MPSCWLLSTSRFLHTSHVCIFLCFSAIFMCRYTDEPRWLTINWYGLLSMLFLFSIGLMPLTLLLLFQSPQTVAMLQSPVSKHAGTQHPFLRKQHLERQSIFCISSPDNSHKYVLMTDGKITPESNCLECEQ